MMLFSSSFLPRKKGGLLGTLSARLFGKQAFYNEPRSILIYLKLFHADAIRTIHPLHKNIAFLDGGLFYGCKDSHSNARDTLYMRSAEVKTEYRRVDAFNQFQLISNLFYLTPQVTAAYLFKTKSVTNDRLVGNLKKKVKEWKKADPGKSYIEMSEVASSDDDGVDDCEEERVEKKGFTKKSFKEPMEKLSTALSTLCSTLENGRDNCLVVNEVLTQYNILAEMTKHRKRVEKMQHETDDDNASNNGSEKGDVSGGSSSPSSGSSDSSSSNESDESNSLENDNDNSEHNSSVHNDEMQQVEKAGQNDTHSSDSGEASHVSNDREGDDNGQENTAQQVQAKHSENGTSDSRQASSANDQHESENIDRVIQVIQRSKSKKLRRVRMAHPIQNVQAPSIIQQTIVRTVILVTKVLLHMSNH